MIVVIADDFSGAAELANVALSRGLSAELQMDFEPTAHADVTCIDADTRALSAEAAAARCAKIGEQIAALKPSLVFKKCDSVLRGHVAVESRALARVLAKRRIMLVPANPSRSRIIRRGEYFIDGVPLAQTTFAADPEHPRRSSRVAELLGDATDVECPDVPDAAAVRELASKIDETMLAVGGADFFEAVLARCSSRPPCSPIEREHARTRLFVCGSNAAWLAGRGEQAARRGVPMPDALLGIDLREDVLTRWANSAAAALRDHGAAMLAIGVSAPHPGVSAATLETRLAQAVECVLGQLSCDRVLLEGGATAATVLRQLGLRRFCALPSPGAGVGAFVPHGDEGPVFLAKPGSYDWPEAAWA